MKLIQLIITVIATFLLAFLISWALDFDWFAREWPRKILIYILMALVLFSGWLVIDEILNNSRN